MSTIDERGPYASLQSVAVAGDCGNLSLPHGAAYEAAALAQNKTVALCHVTKNSTLFGIYAAWDALGANNGLTFGYAWASDGIIVNAAFFKTVEDASSAGAVFEPIMEFTPAEDILITVTKTGAGTATGTIVGKPLFTWRGGD